MNGAVDVVGLALLDLELAGLGIADTTVNWISSMYGTWSPFGITT